MTLDTTAILDAVQSQVQALALFDTVNLHEPKSKPGNGLTCAIWADRIAPLPAASGLASTTGLVVLALRTYTSMLQQPFDAIDPNMISAVDALIAGFSGTFTLSGSVRDIDLLGEFGTPLSAQAGYINQDGKLMRVMTLTVALVVNDIWAQIP